MIQGAVEFPAGDRFHIGHIAMGEHEPEVQRQRIAVYVIDGEDLKTRGSRCDAFRLFVVRLLEMVVNSREEPQRGGAFIASGFASGAFEPEEVARAARESDECGEERVAEDACFHGG